MRLTGPKRKIPALFPKVSRLFAPLLALWLAAGCAASHTTVLKPARAPLPLQTATKAELIADYNQLANAVRSVNLAVTMALTAGSAYTGVIKQYHEVNGFILAEKPSDIRVIGELPVVGTKIFDMVSDADTFRISIPSQHKFLTGPTQLERPSAKPIENLRPQHLTGAIFWPVIPDDAPVLLEEAGDGGSFYVLTVVRRTGQSGGTDSGTDWQIQQKVWIDRTDLSLARLETYEAGGKIGADIAFRGWDTFGGLRYPRQVSLSRPANDYTLEIGITKATFNETIPADRFELNQAAGEELVKVGEDTKSDSTPGAPGAEPKN